MDETRFDPEEMDLIRNAIAPGDILLELCELSLADGTAHVTAALSKRAVYLIGYRKIRKGLQITRHSTVLISNISSISKRKQGNKLWIALFYEGKQENYFAKPRWVNEANELIDHLQHLMTAGSSGQGTLSIADEIAKLAQLTDEGILSEEELARAKELFLGQPHSNIDESIQLLRNLHELQKKGVLSESEFNMKKWDVLSKRDFQ